MKIKSISEEEAIIIIETRKALGKFICVEGEKIVAIDNEDGEAWCEDFKENERLLAIRYLKGDYELDEKFNMVEPANKMIERIKKNCNVINKPCNDPACEVQELCKSYFTDKEEK